MQYLNGLQILQWEKNINSIYFKFKIIIVLGLHYVSVHNSAASQ